MLQRESTGARLLLLLVPAAGRMRQAAVACSRSESLNATTEPPAAVMFRAMPRFSNMLSTSNTEEESVA